MSESKKQVFVKGVAVDGIPKIRYDVYFRIFGLVSSELDIEAKMGQSKQTEPPSRLRRLYCQLICTMLWFFAIRSFVLMFIPDRGIQLMMGDLTGYWNDYRMYYLMPMLFFSLQTAITSTIFLVKERDLAWLVPFLSIKQLQSNTKGSNQFRPQAHKLRIYLGIVFDFVSSLLNMLIQPKISLEITDHGSDNHCSSGLRLLWHGIQHDGRHDLQDVVAMDRRPHRLVLLYGRYCTNP